MTSSFISCHNDLSRNLDYVSLSSRFPSGMPNFENPPTRPLMSLYHGMRGLCSRCGEGPLFRRGLKAWERCSACDLRYQRNQGDVWMFVIMMNRIPVALGVAIVYFGFRAASLETSILFFLSLAGPLLATVRHRQGIALALDYLSRVYLPDSSDEIHKERALANTEAIRRSRMAV